MKTHAGLIGLALALAPLSIAHAAEDMAQAKDECKQEEQQKGTGDKTSEVKCAIKVIFQNRIRRKKDTDPVEMTVGSPPMVTDDTDTPGSGNWEINVGLHGDFAGSEHTIEAPLLDINYGVGDTLQFKYEVPYVFARQAQSIGGADTFASVHGIGDSNFGVKYRFYDNEDAGLSFAVYPQVQFESPGGSRAISEGRTVLIVPLIMTREFEHSSITANIGVEASSVDRRYFASFGIGKRLTDHMAAFTEIAGDNLNATDEKHVLINVGLRRKLSDRTVIVGSLGHDVYAGGDQLRHTYFMLAYQLSLGDEPK